MNLFYVIYKKIKNKMFIILA